MKRLIIGLALVFSLAQSADAVTAYYQPTPYSSAVPLQYHHIWDGWLNSFFPSILTFQQNDYLRLGGWGDTYRTYVRFDTVGLPQNVSKATLRLMPFEQSGTMANTRLYRVDGTWDAATTSARSTNPQTAATTVMTWGTQPVATSLGTRVAPTLPNVPWDVDITEQYNAWATIPATNFGIRIDPFIDNSPTISFWSFRSSRYADYVNDLLADGKRPVLQLEFTAPVTVPDFKIPLPGNHRWLVTTEIGGVDCVGPVSTDAINDPWPDPAHTDPSLDPQLTKLSKSNYFSIDFAFTNFADQDAKVFTKSVDKKGDIITDVPVIAAASGKVAKVGYDQKLNGHYIVLNHSGASDEATGFTTRYLHLVDMPARQDGTRLKKGDDVAQGAQIGFMGNTGLSKGPHLHFGVRYNNSGDHTVSELGYVVMDGLLLKSFQTECAQGKMIRYYRSGNTVY